MMAAGEDGAKLVGVPLVAPFAAPQDRAKLAAAPLVAPADASQEAESPLLFGSGGNAGGAARVSYAEIGAHALQIEEVALELDRAGDAEQAGACYKQAADRFASAAAECPESNQDKAALARRAGQLFGRVVYLESLAGAKASLPPEEHIVPADRPLCGAACVVASANASDADAEARWGQRVKQSASAAAIVGTSALLVLHAPVIAVAAAAGSAYATTREDGAGEAARSVGDAGIQVSDKVTDKVKTFVEEQNVPEKMKQLEETVRAADKYGVVDKMEAAKSTSLRALQDFDSKHDVSGKVASGLSTASKSVESATTSSWHALQDFDSKHDVRNKVALGFASASSAVANWVSRAAQRDAGV